MNKPKLKRCPFCGEVPVEGYRLGANWHKCESGEVYISCSSPKHEGMCLLVYGESFEQAAEKWNCRTPLPDNKALTVEELREMDGEPVWCEKKGAYVFVSTIIDEPYIQVYYFTNKGFLETVLYYHTKFYRRPPEKGD